MHRFQAAEATRTEPAGHFGGLTLSNVVPWDVGGHFSTQLSYCPPGGGGEMHSHSGEAQLFLMLDGELTFDTAEGRFTLGPQDAVLFQPGEKHATLNESATTSVAVVVTVRVA